MSDLVRRLRGAATHIEREYRVKAADEIERLCVELEWARVAYKGAVSGLRAALAEVERLVVDVNDYMQIANQQVEELAELTAERDALRAEIERLRVPQDCRLCLHYTTKSGGCRSTARCVEGDMFVSTAPRQFWRTILA